MRSDRLDGGFIVPHGWVVAAASPLHSMDVFRFIAC